MANIPGELTVALFEPMNTIP